MLGTVWRLRCVVYDLTALFHTHTHTHMRIRERSGLDNNVSLYMRAGIPAGFTAPRLLLSGEERRPHRITLRCVGGSQRRLRGADWPSGGSGGGTRWFPGTPSLLSVTKQWLGVHTAATFFLHAPFESRVLILVRFGSSHFDGISSVERILEQVLTSQSGHKQRTARPVSTVVLFIRFLGMNTG